MIKIVSAQDPIISSILVKEYTDLPELEERVKDILKDVRKRGNEAVLDYTRRFDRAELNSTTIRVTPAEIEAAYSQVDEEFITAIRIAAENIRKFHEKQKHNTWLEPESKGVLLGQLYRPLKRVGTYVPGGTANYPSSVLMNAIPAKVAGVSEIVMVTPPKSDGFLNPHVLVAAAEAGVAEIYKVGGAQAIAALAFGTETIKPVDLITGPGNIYVTLAKKMVYGQVNIDMLAGPSEILIIADDTANPSYIAADLLSQAEHDPRASAILVTPSKSLAEAVQKEVERQVNLLTRKNIAIESLNKHGAIIITSDLNEAIKLANQCAPEHLEIMVENPFFLLSSIENAGAIFLGSYSPEPVGDYLAGPNHVLPTGGTARFYSPLNLDIFMKKSSIIAYSKEALLANAQHIIKIAELEGLEAHANSVKVRLANQDGK